MTGDSDSEAVEGDNAEDERRLFERTRPETAAFLASDLGVTRISLAGNRVGEFALAHRCVARSIATTAGAVAVGTDDDVLIGDGERFEPTGFGPAVAVGVHDGTVLAAAKDGRVGRTPVDVQSPDQWETVGEVDKPRRFDGDLLATAGGVFRIGETVTMLGLADVRDVAAGIRVATPPDSTEATIPAERSPDSTEGEPLAATAEGLYRFDGEWHRTVEGDAVRVANGRQPVAAVDGDFLERNEEGWQRRSHPVEEQIVALASGESCYAVTDAGTFLVYAEPDVTDDGRGGWRSRRVGVPETAALALG
jgi:hypothetical protein